MSHDKHQAFFDELAAEWDLAFTAEDLERLGHIVDSLNVKPDQQILDLGCGTGILFDMLRRRVGDNGSVTGVDFSFEMAQKACRNFPFANVNVVDADVTSLPFRDGTFDIAVAFASFPHFSDQQKALDEIHRVLKPASRLYIIHLASSRELNEMHRRIGGAVADDALPSEDHLRKMFQRSRYKDISIDDHPGLFVASAVSSQ